MMNNKKTIMFSDAEEQAAKGLARILQGRSVMDAVVRVLLDHQAVELACELTAWQEWAAFPQGQVTYRWAIAGLLEQAKPLWAYAQEIVDALKAKDQRQAGIDFASALIMTIYPIHK
jgi:hypothetical protein